MDAFESIIGTILEREGFWVRTNFKVELTKAEKRKIGKASCPRWELDVLAYRPKDNQLWVVECKSFLDSKGVSATAFRPGHKGNTRYKLFTDPTLRKVVLGRLEKQLLEAKSIRTSPKIRLCLVAGKIVASKAEELEALFKRNKWHLFGPGWINEKLHLVAEDGYDNAIAAVTAKLLLKK